MKGNEPQLITNRDAIALVPQKRSDALSLFFALALTTAAMILLGFGPKAHADATGGDPSSMVKGTVGQVLNVLQDKQNSQAERQRKVIEIVSGHFDLTDMARSSLGYNWKKLSPAQQQQFVPLFTAFMEDAYLNKISAYSGQKVQFLPQNSVGASEAEVRSIVLPAESGDQPIKINYMLKQSGGDWKVYDVTVDDISITANYRNQFTRIINDKGFDSLMSTMRDKEQELRESIGA
jgi:phospholipid transport system substrate-binding protein